MKLHLMYVNGSSNIDGLKKISELANKCNYYSVLLVYHSLENDFWIKCANVLDTTHTFKYMIAIRTYAISPEYFVMMYRGFSEIQENRIMFNIVSGDIHDSETSVDDIIFNKENFYTSQKRVKYTHEWIKKVLSIIDKKKVPEIVMSGTSDNTLNSASVFADYNLCMMDSFVDNPKKFKRNKNRMVCAALIIRNTYEEAEKVVDQIKQKHQKRWTIFGTEEQVLEKIEYLKSIGVTDLMIRNHKEDNKYNLVHEFVAKNKGII